MGMISFLNIKPKQVDAMKPENIAKEAEEEIKKTVGEKPVEIDITFNKPEEMKINFEEPKEEVKETSTRRRRRN